MGNSKSRHDIKKTTRVEKEEQDGATPTLSDNPKQKAEKAEELSDLELAYKDQGYHEMEFTHGNESELHETKMKCQKNPGHLDFIPAKEFNKNHLPECWRDGLVFEFITTLINLTVRLAVGYTSESRPSDYPLYNRRGQYGLTVFGSGVVRYIQRKFTEKDEGTCPCNTCTQFPNLAKRQWGQFVVHTAMHVVFDTSEATHTKCNLFFDSDEDRYDCISLECVRVEYRDFERDSCHVSCVTHDKDVCTKLEKINTRYWELREKLKDKFKKEGLKRKTAVIVSHPHGLSKYVTVGEVKGRQEVSPFKWKYCAETCTGSSGAPVFILANCNLTSKNLGTGGPFHPTHSGCQQKGQNESIGYSWYGQYSQK